MLAMDNNNNKYRYIKLLNEDMNHHGFQWQLGCNVLPSYQTYNDPNLNALHICEVKDFFIWMTLYPKIKWVAYASISDNARYEITDNKVKSEAVVLHEPLIPVIDFIPFALQYHAFPDYFLPWAMRYERLDFIKCAIKHRKPPSYIDYNLFKWAAVNGYLEIIDSLLENGTIIMKHSTKDNLLSLIKHAAPQEMVDYVHSMIANPRRSERLANKQQITKKINC